MTTSHHAALGPYPDRAPVSQALFDRAKAIVPGGVNSPVPAFQAVGGTPRFMVRGYGPWMIDVDSRRYVDLVCSWGALIHGHAHPTIIAAAQCAAAHGTSFGTSTEGEVELAEGEVELAEAIFTAAEVVDYDSAKTPDAVAFKAFFHAMPAALRGRRRVGSPLLSKPTRTTVHVPRHGEVYNPNIDPVRPPARLPPSGLGRQMAKAATEALADCDVTYLVASPLERAQETAEPFAAQLKLETATDTPLIESSNFFEGKMVSVGDGAFTWHDPRRRQCGLASLTWFVFEDAKIVGIEYAEPAAALVAMSPGARTAEGACRFAGSPQSSSPPR